MIQSLLGKLMHLSHCITAARKFTARITSTLSYMHTKNQRWTMITDEFKADVDWFRKFAALSNGRALIAPEREGIFIECDSSLSGGGGHSSCAYYSWEYTELYKA